MWYKADKTVVSVVMADLKKIYQAPSEDDTLYRLEEFAENWNKKYPQIYKSWNENWSELSAYFKYPDDVRRLIYTTNSFINIKCPG